MASLKELTEADVVALSEAAGEPDWLRDVRQEAYKALADLEWPTAKVEEWRYTDPRKIELGRPLVSTVGASGPRGEGIAAAAEPAALVRIVDGGVAEARVSDEAAAQGVIATDLATAAREHPELVGDRLGTVVGASEAFTAASLAAFTVGAFLHVPADARLEAPLTVTIQVSEPGAHVPRVLASFGAHATADLLVDRAGSGEATVVEVLEVAADEGARVRVASAQDWGEGVVHVGWHRASVGRNAEVKSLETTLGGDIVYLRPDVRLDGEGGNGELHGVYYSSGRQHFEHRSLIHHNASHTSSDSVYKGALQDTSRAVWYGNIRIEPHAKATTSDETNRNLILTDGARADSIPWLEILTSDVVACGHHSSIGQIDEMQLFYLESRGIPRAEAARLLVFGFFTEVLERVGMSIVTETVLADIEAQLFAAPIALLDPRRS